MLSRKAKTKIKSHWNYFNSPSWLIPIRRHFLNTIILMLFCCTETANGLTEFPPVEFNLHNDLLSDVKSINGGNFNFQIPRNLMPLSEIELNKLRSIFDNDSNAYFSLTLINAYKSENGISCLISKIHEKNIFENLGDNFKLEVGNNFNTNNIVRSQFSINGINTVQYSITTSQIAAIKLFCLIGSDYFQLDYFIPISIYEKELRSIESSIGSITTKTNRR